MITTPNFTRAADRCRRCVPWISPTVCCTSAVFRRPCSHRYGWATSCVPAALRDALYKAKLLDDLGSPSVEQAALATFIQSRQYEKHLRKSVKELINRRRTVVEALQRLASRHVEIGPHHAGMHLVIWFRHMSFDRLSAFIDRAKSLGLGLHPIHPYYQTPPAAAGTARRLRGTLRGTTQDRGGTLRALPGRRNHPQIVVPKYSCEADVDRATHCSYAAPRGQSPVGEMQRMQLIGNRKVACSPRVG